MSYNLFLDDTRKPFMVTWVKLPENAAWETAKSFDEFVHLIETKGVPSLVSYDCDLCDEHYEAFFKLRHRYVIDYKLFKTRCGIHCLEYFFKFLKKHNLKHPPYTIHTQNHYAGPFMDNMIKRFNGEAISLERRPLILGLDGKPVVM